jgi:uncharacterized protein YggU (UPF0235/DUF167 family)
VSGGTVRVTVRVHPGSRITDVGGRFGDVDPPVLTVRVAAPAVDGRANRAVETAVADAFGVARRQVSLRSGHASRTKVLDVEGGDPARLRELLQRSPGGGPAVGPR